MEQTSIVGSENGLRHKVSVPNTLGLNGRLVEALDLGLRGRDETIDSIQKFGEEMADVARLRARLPLVIALAIVEQVRYPIVYKISMEDPSFRELFHLDHFVTDKPGGLFGKTLEIFNLIKGESIKGYSLPACLVCGGGSPYISVDIAGILNIG
ncbi:hypothetical protein A2996_03375 [Candidatus Campbellbacteria bacterium RIFCSPLOWO2_01_FULL_34_15]|uniref:Uncharacterized protein n=2 Tax=Candidatus Campbelliibacteriota TaxID=1752727 RepID=A0A1F5EPP2_9BACT|nr:MAG: hypothetical protein A2811_01195 [Candidatus Campbellbacteria bacterium RIFCSPHIGHO2_01_FULL_34_10]OGD69361.1 MAG: hypothetical protein A2996_03375 [Candidatus Campbellbacteria bacterium RIFCSPLOWO2_01_FULL_34_15]